MPVLRVRNAILHTGGAEKARPIHLIPHASRGVSSYTSGTGRMIGTVGACTVHDLDAAVV